MRTTSHIILSTAVSAAYWSISKDVPSTVVCFVSGILIDLDHFIDYWIMEKKFSLNLPEFFKYFDNRIDKVYVFFHGYEWFILMWAAIWYYQLSWMWLGFGVGITTHLISDIISNPIKPFGYSFFYRLSKGFNSDQILTAKYFETHR